MFEQGHTVVCDLFLVSGHVDGYSIRAWNTVNYIGYGAAGHICSCDFTNNIETSDGPDLRYVQLEQTTTHFFYLVATVTAKNNVSV